MQYESLQVGTQEECRAIQVVGAGDSPSEMLEVGEEIRRGSMLLEHRKYAIGDVVGDLIVCDPQNFAAIFEDLFPVFLEWGRGLECVVSARLIFTYEEYRPIQAPVFLIFSTSVTGTSQGQARENLRNVSYRPVMQHITDRVLATEHSVLGLATHGMSSRAWTVTVCHWENRG